MAYDTQNAVWDLNGDRTMIWVLMVLAKLQDPKTRQCRWSMPTICDQARMGETQVRAALKKAVQAGYLRWESGKVNHETSSFNLLFTPSETEEVGQGSIGNRGSNSLGNRANSESAGAEIEDDKRSTKEGMYLCGSGEKTKTKSGPNPDSPPR